MGNTFNSSGGKQNIAIGKHSVAKETNTCYAAPQAPAEDLLKLLTEIKARLPAGQGIGQAAAVVAAA
jgi:hypothetical protein